MMGRSKKGVAVAVGVGVGVAVGDQRAAVIGLGPLRYFLPVRERGFVLIGGGRVPISETTAP